MVAVNSIEVVAVLILARSEEHFQLRHWLAYLRIHNVILIFIMQEMMYLKM